MRRSLPSLLAILLAACTVTTTGAPCTSDLNCPSDQGCGADGTCSAAALSCPGHTTAGQCRPGTTCDGDQLITCTPAAGVCSTGPVTSACPAHQACSTSGGVAACACAPTSCSATTASFCGPGGELVTCAQDGAGCRYPASSAPCGDPATTCVASGGSAACTCPAQDACTQEGALACSATGQAVLRCQPAVAGSSCLTWQALTDCAASSLVCSAGSCACPPATPGLVHADAVNGGLATAPLHPTGALVPAACRFASLADALQALGGAGTVRATGWTPAVAGGAVVFAEAGGLDLAAGVTLTTDDASPDPAHYAITTAASLTRPLLRVGPGATLSGFELRNAASTGPGIETACPLAGDTAAVTLAGVGVAAAASAAPGSRLSSGLRVAGHCPVTATRLTVSGAATGILVEPLAPAVEVAVDAGQVTGSTVAAAAVVDGRLTLTGGAVGQNAAGVLVGPSGNGSPTFTATGTSFTGNTGDALFVARGTATTDACPYSGNGTHVHAQPAPGSVVNVTVQNSAGAAKMTGASNSAFRLLAMGGGSTLTLNGNEITGNSATQDYNVSTGQRRGGGLVFTAPFPGNIAFRRNTVSSNSWDQVLVAASTGVLDLRGGPDCIATVTATRNTFKCYDAAHPSV
ncbi:MAG TPA: hypothetical protein VFM53_16045, partial [Anaeromyxobacteraceae bacterium]|nr:hypothetical protein [Anaeromyxobacteraceae bacterium]